jgi:alpha-D-xyloside xylohydrolase
MPYLYARAFEATQTGVPLMRSMLMEYPQDPACATLDRQYQLGESLLVAPVFTESGEVDFYLPQGTWTHLLSGEKKQGGRWHRETHGFLSMPLYAAPNSVIAWGAETERPDYDYGRGTVLRVFELDDGASVAFEVAAVGGGIAARGRIRREDRHYTAEVGEGVLRDWAIEVDGRRSPVQAEGGTLSWSAG